MDSLKACMGNALAEKVAEMLTRRGLSIAAAESLTGGQVSMALTSIPGSSRYFLGSVVAYHNGVKESLLAVPGETLLGHGAVSRETALSMAEGVRNLMKADLGIATTGIAGPSGGSAEKPVGTVHLALVKEGEALHRKLNLEGPRDVIQYQTTQEMLEMIREAIET